MENRIDEAKERFVNKYNLKNCIYYNYGSRLYGTNNNTSDYDFIVIVPDNSQLTTGTEFLIDKFDFQIYQLTDFKNQLDLHKIQTLECYYQNKNIFKFKLNLFNLRTSISEKASHSFVKAKKKIEKEKDYYIGWKSLFHSLRILNYGIQIAKNDNIQFEAMNQYWFDILNSNQYEWEYFKEKYQPIYNSLSSEFKLLAPKKEHH